MILPLLLLVARDGSPFAVLIHTAQPLESSRVPTPIPRKAALPSVVPLAELAGVDPFSARETTDLAIIRTSDFVAPLAPIGELEDVVKVVDDHVWQLVDQILRNLRQNVDPILAKVEKSGGVVLSKAHQLPPLSFDLSVVQSIVALASRNADP